VGALEATGVWDSQGHRVDSNIQDAVARVQSATLPASVRLQAQAIRDETAIVLAVHQFTADFADPTIAFLSRYVP
jgi:hypothetical protein